MLLVLSLSIHRKADFEFSWMGASINVKALQLKIIW